MSARIVLLSFKDNLAAEQFCKLVAKGQNEENIMSGQEDEDNDLFIAAILKAYGKLEAMVARPTVWCRHKSRRGVDWKKTKRFGWWVHARCNMPSKAAVMYFVDHMLNGCRDLLPELFGQKDRPPVRNYQTVPDSPFGLRSHASGELHVSSAQHDQGLTDGPLQRRESVPPLADQQGPEG